MRIGLPAALVLSLCASAHAAQYFAFDLENSGTSVCRVEQVPAKTPQTCLSTVQSLGSEMAPTVEIVDRTKALQAIEASRGLTAQMTKQEFDSVGGAVLLTPAEMETITKNFKRLSFRNLSIQTPKEGDTSIAFFASVYWVGTDGVEQGTINVSGRFVNAGNAPGAGANVVQVQKALAGMVDIEQISDSWTEHKIPFLRGMERGARKVEFEQIDGVGGDIDQETVDFLKTIVAPVIFGEILYVPVMESMANFIKTMDNSAAGPALFALPPPS